VTFAVIPTAWGLCGAIWINRESERAGVGVTAAFAERPSEALLCRILTPGLAVSQLRGQIMRTHPNASEVFGDGHGNFHPEVVPEWFGELVRYLQGYYTANLRDLTQPQFVDNWTFWRPRLDWSQVTPFQRQVLEQCAQIPSGQQMTYGQIAKRLGKPAASRAVGAALGSNPWPVLVPCHRVLGKKGKLTGFSAPGGISTKQRMLDMEQRGLLSDV